MHNPFGKHCKSSYHEKLKHHLYILVNDEGKKPTHKHAHTYI